MHVVETITMLSSLYSVVVGGGEAREEVLEV